MSLTQHEKELLVAAAEADQIAYVSNFWGMNGHL